MSKNIDKTRIKNLNGKCQKPLNHDKQSPADALKTVSKIAICKTAEATDNMISNKIVDKITKLSRGLPQNSSKTVKSETENIGFDRERPKERYLYLKKVVNY